MRTTIAIVVLAIGMLAVIYVGVEGLGPILRRHALAIDELADELHRLQTSVAEQGELASLLSSELHQLQAVVAQQSELIAAALGQEILTLDQNPLPSDP